VHRASQRCRPNRSSTLHVARKRPQLGDDSRAYVLHKQYGYSRHVRYIFRIVLASGGPLLTLSWCRSNAPDFASRAKRPFAAGLPQLLAVPFTFSIVSFIGIIVSSSSQVIFGEPVWSPVDLLDRFLDDHPSHATRFGVCSGVRSEVRSRGSRGANRCGSYRPRLSSHRYVTFPCPVNSGVHHLR
jgi:hypothetical protein